MTLATNEQRASSVTSISKVLGRKEAKLSAQQFSRIGQFITSRCGIKLPLAKKLMVESRVRKRLRELGIDGFETYCDFVFDTQAGKKEQINLVDVITTNKTDFFREPHHFEVLSQRVLPEFFSKGVGHHSSVHVWSAASSTGEEIYTLAMVLEEFGRAKKKKLRYDIIGSDISTQVLAHAKRAVYREALIEPVPMALRKRYLLRTKDRAKKEVRITPELRRNTRFGRLNLMDPEYRLPHSMHVIFCRNVLIYFDQKTQESIVNKLCKNLTPDGWLFLGHSESVNGLNVPLEQLAPTVYRLK